LQKKEDSKKPVPRRPLPDLPQSVSANQNPPNIDIGLEKSLKGAASDYYETPGVDEILIDKSYGYVVNNEVIHNHDGFYSRLFKKTQVKDKLRGSQTQTPGIDEILIDKSYGYVEHNQVNHNPDDIQIDSSYNVSGKKGGKILSDGLYSKLLFKTQTQDKFTGPQTDTLLKDKGNQRDCTLHKTTDNDKDCDKSFNNETLDKLRGNLNTTYYKLKALVENMKDKDKQNDTDTCDNLYNNKDKNGQKDTATESKTEHNTQNDTDKSQKENLFAKYLKLKLLNKTTADNVADKVDNENNHKDTTDIHNDSSEAETIYAEDSDDEKDLQEDIDILDDEKDTQDDIDIVDNKDENNANDHNLGQDSKDENEIEGKNDYDFKKENHTEHNKEDDNDNDEDDYYDDDNDADDDDDYEDDDDDDEDDDNDDDNDNDNHYSDRFSESFKLRVLNQLQKTQSEESWSESDFI
jgi:hypothetical protein